MDDIGRMSRDIEHQVDEVLVKKIIEDDDKRMVANIDNHVDQALEPYNNEEKTSKDVLFVAGGVLIGAASIAAASYFIWRAFCITREITEALVTLRQAAKTFREATQDWVDNGCPPLEVTLPENFTVAKAMDENTADQTRYSLSGPSVPEINK
ncbi:hypothetical protein ACH5RR_020747 [Cinchona calisaya]|uniref:Uncharacterized protein n=1 Tax=Cinchona calisaya TaxID=153742 RepID=A0ABD2ZFG2_9GENT